MDKSWMHLDSRLHPRYAKGVNEFLKFAIDHMGNTNTIRCPCYNCNNVFWLTPEQVGDHLLIHGIVRSYDPWVYHGEMPDSNDSKAILEDIDDNIEEDTDDDGDATQELAALRKELEECKAREKQALKKTQELKGRLAEMERKVKILLDLHERQIDSFEMIVGMEDGNDTGDSDTSNSFEMIVGMEDGNDTGDSDTSKLEGRLAVVERKVNFLLDLHERQFDSFKTIMGMEDGNDTGDSDTSNSFEMIVGMEDGNDTGDSDTSNEG